MPVEELILGLGSVIWRRFGLGIYRILLDLGGLSAWNRRFGLSMFRIEIFDCQVVYGGFGDVGKCQWKCLSVLTIGQWAEMLRLS
jgi:hypothetical protein